MLLQLDELVFGPGNLFVLQGTLLCQQALHLVGELSDQGVLVAEVARADADRADRLLPQIALVREAHEAGRLVDVQRTLQLLPTLRPGGVHLRPKQRKESREKSNFC